ncbi:DUF4342 domain-containing protein [Clostridium sp.]|uniref:DUF4342 domain-containing protein n=1 Tax=Clostridium sp. TaxID=1506 RepID=UPI003F392108
MEKLKAVEKLRDKANVSYEEAKDALEKSNWDILDAMLSLEASGIVKKPSISVFYTNEHKEGSNNNREILNMKKEEKDYNYKKKNDFEGIFEAVCKVIDTGNNIFIYIKRKEKIFLKIPLTVVALLLFFAFWIIIPSVIVGLFFDIEFVVSSNKINVDNIDKVNNISKEMSKHAREIREKIKKGVK